MVTLAEWKDRAHYTAEPLCADAAHAGPDDAMPCVTGICEGDAGNLARFEAGEPEATDAFRKLRVAFSSTEKEGTDGTL